MKSKQIKSASLCISLLLLISLPVLAVDNSETINLKYYPAAAACISSLNLPGVTGAGLVDMGSVYMEYDERDRLYSGELDKDTTEKTVVDGGDYLTATDEDFEELARMLSYCGNPIAYSSLYNEKVMAKVAKIGEAVLSQKEIYQFYFGTDGYEEISAEKAYELGFLNSASDGFSYRSYSTDKMDWILENIFNDFNNNFDWSTEDEYFNIVSCCRIGDRYYSAMTPDATWMSFEKIISKKPCDLRSYDVVCQYRDIQNETYSEYTYHIKLVEIDGKRYWKFYDVEIKEEKQ